MSQLPNPNLAPPVGVAELATIPFWKGERFEVNSTSGTTTTGCAVRLLPNRVARSYHAGGLLDKLTGTDRGDIDCPEDWLGSCVRPYGASTADVSGLGSVVVGGRPRLVRELVGADPVGWLGQRHVTAFGADPAVLVKLLDPGERLPLHVHPTRRFARRHLDSRFGKTEAWLVLALGAGQRSGSVWVGFREGVTLAHVAEQVARQSSSDLLGLTHEFSVAPGDAVFVPAGTPHAIGPGMLLLEPQEPTDFSLLAEHRPFSIGADEATLGLGWERALEVFAVDGVPRDVAEARHVRRQVFATAAAADEVDCLAGFATAAEPYFQAHWSRVTSRSDIAVDGLWTGIVLAGAGMVVGQGGQLDVQRGHVFLVPAGAAPIELRSSGSIPLEIIRVMPPSPEPLGDAW